MKKILTLIPLLCLTLFFMCSCERRARLSANTMFISIEPANTIELSVGSSSASSLQAVIRDSFGNRIHPDSVLWSISNNELGFFSDSSSPDTSFVAVNTGTGIITLSYCGMQAQVAVEAN